MIIFLDDTEGWETVQRVRSKLRTSPPHKFSASSPGNVRSNSISGFEMYSEKSSRVNNSNTTRRSPQIETVSNGKPLRNSQMQATTSPNTKLPSRPKSSKSLPSLHVKTPERSPNQIVDKSKKTVSSVTKLKTGLNSPGTLDILKSGLKSGDSKKQPFTNNIKVKDGFKYTASGNVMRPSDLKKQSSDAKLVTGRSSTIAKTIHRTSVSVRQSRELNTGKNITSKRSHPPENDKDVPGVVETNPVDAIRRAAIPEDQTESPCEKSVPVSLLKVGDDCGDKKDIPLVESSIDKSLTNEVRYIYNCWHHKVHST